VRRWLIGGGAFLVLLLVCGVLFVDSVRKTPPDLPRAPDAPAQSIGDDSLVQAALDDKDYRGASEILQRVLERPPGPGTLPARARKLLDHVRLRLTEVEQAAIQAEEAFASGRSEIAAEKLAELLDLDPRHVVAVRLTESLGPRFRARVATAREQMADARRRAERANAIDESTGSRGERLFAAATQAARDAEDAFAAQAFGRATRRFLEARDDYERARRAIEAGLAAVARRKASWITLMRVPAEQARATMTAARERATKRRPHIDAAREEFESGIVLATRADAELASHAWLAAWSSCNEARAAFERAFLLSPPPASPTTARRD
jgi:tetratricopeptide (TPR) repeat protein